jgi:hypothetical protein
MSLNYCDIELNGLFRCLVETPVSQCGCYESEDYGSFTETYPNKLEELFLTTNSFFADTDPKYCSAANSRMCDYVVENNSCCCGGYIETYRQCFFNEYLLSKYPSVLVANYCEATKSCMDDPSGNDVAAFPETQSPSSGGGGEVIDKTMIHSIAGGAAGALVLLGLIMCFCCRRHTNPRGEEDKDTEPKSVGDDVETGSESLNEEGDRQHLQQPQHASPTSTASDTDTRQKSKAAMTDDEAILLRKESLRKKRAAIEGWNDGKKQGSDRSLQSYKSDQGL